MVIYLLGEQRMVNPEECEGILSCSENTLFSDI